MGHVGKFNWTKYFNFGLNSALEDCNILFSPSLQETIMHCQGQVEVRRHIWTQYQWHHQWVNGITAGVWASTAFSEVTNIEGKFWLSISSCPFPLCLWTLARAACCASLLSCLVACGKPSGVPVLQGFTSQLVVWAFLMMIYQDLGLGIQKVPKQGRSHFII